ncbi:MAG TPA: hypothetical protein VFW45_12360 [Candidatus Polarisedimenticolia bacterium]|nr:hypothetical protein [Candidatus Polarisedimenticolia bacterium]
MAPACLAVWLLIAAREPTQVDRDAFPSPGEGACCVDWQSGPLERHPWRSAIVNAAAAVSAAAVRTWFHRVPSSR